MGKGNLYKLAISGLNRFFKGDFRRLVDNSLLRSFLIGAVLIVPIRLLFSGNVWATLIAVLIAIFIIIFLGYYYYRSETKDFMQAGDDLYYLGLLFTLVSLICALVSLFILNPEGDLEQRTYDLIGSFGIALSSTVVGILARIVMQDLGGRLPGVGKRPGPDKPDDALALRRELRQATDAFSHFTRMTLVQAQQTAVHSERLIKDFNERMSASARRNLEEVATSWREVVQKMDAQSEQAIERTEKKWRALTESVETAFSTLATGLEANEQRVNALGKTITNVTTRLDERSTEIVQAYEALVQGTQEWRRELETSIQAMSAMPGHIKSANSAFNTLSGQLEATYPRINALGKIVADVTTRLDERAAEIVKAYDALVQNLQQQQENGLQACKDAISNLSDLLRAEHGQLQSILNAYRKSVEECVEMARKQQEVVQHNAGQAQRLSELTEDQALVQASPPEPGTGRLCSWLPGRKS